MFTCASCLKELDDSKKAKKTWLSWSDHLISEEKKKELMASAHIDAKVCETCFHKADQSTKGTRFY